MLTWTHGFGTPRRAGVECTRSYGAALTWYLLSSGLELVAVNQLEKGQPSPATTRSTALFGVSPVEASSGKTDRLHLNRGGDWQANYALYTIVLFRLRWDVRSRAYTQRRIAEGKTRHEAIRCLKR
jgi:hypothetical protein